MAALWFVVLAVSKKKKTLTDTSVFVSRNFSCRDGRGNKPTGKTHGSNHGNGRRKMKGPKTNNFRKKKKLKEGHPWLTPTESCAWDETEEEEEEAKPFRASPPGLSDPFTEEAKKREPRPESDGC